MFVIFTEIFNKNNHGKTAFQGAPVSLAGEFIKVGAQAPEFSLVKGDLSSFTQNDIKGKYALLNIFPSMDTGVCATSVRKFNKLAAEMENTVVLAISKDLPLRRDVSVQLKELKMLFHFQTTDILLILEKNMVY